MKRLKKFSKMRTTSNVTAESAPVLPKKNRKEGKKGSKKAGSGLFSIRNKLVAAFMVTVVPIALLGVFSYNTASKSIKETASNTSYETVSQVSKYIANTLSGIKDISMQIFMEKDFQNHIAAIYEETTVQNINIRNSLNESLTIYMIGNKLIEGIHIIVDNNKSISTSQSGIYLARDSFGDIKNSELFAKAAQLNGNVLWIGRHEAVDKHFSGKPKYSISLVRAIMNRSVSKTEAQGLLIIDLKESLITDAFSGVNLGNSSELHLISPDGRDIAYIVNEGVMEALDTTSEENQIVGLDFFESLKSGQNNLVEQFKDQECLIINSAVGDTGYNLVAIIPTANFLASAQGIRYITLLFTCIAVIFAVGMGLFIAIGLGRAIKKVADASLKASEGDFTVTFNTKRKDEVGTLANTFNMMMENVRKLIVGASDTAVKVIQSASTVAATSKEVAAASREVSRAVEEISKGATAQAIDSEQSTIKMRDLAEKINAVSDFAKAIESYSKDTIVQTKQGLSSVVDLENKAKETTEITRAILADIQALENNSKNIGNIIKVIDGIADQTNLLALNAAIEAARAGESGRGFAVVADEIRKLAEQSAAATKEISKIISENQNQTSNAVQKAELSENILKSQNMAVANTMEVFGRISESMESLAKLVDDIMTGVEEMNAYKDDTVMSIQNISAVSEEIAASTQEVTASTEQQLSSIEQLASYAQQLDDAAKILQSDIQKFKVN
ncbi:MAG: methyl-accepting chemotaxis protein [Clostridiaceae bacterium]|nr:methyl-accepting chemotaxis protein [Clostridiaceae bacterium]